MATQDDDTDPDLAPSPAELAQARRFADAVDQTLAGRAPAVMAAEDRALVEVATVIRASHGRGELSVRRQHEIVEAALRSAIGGVTPIGRARARRAPWIVAGATSLVAVAAVALLWLRPAPKLERRAAVPAEWTSRSADALVGPIAREHAGDAATRIDAIFADRLDGFRARRLTRGGQ
jgi:hypothetical protein